MQVKEFSWLMHDVSSIYEIYTKLEYKCALCTAAIHTHNYEEYHLYLCNIMTNKRIDVHVPRMFLNAAL